MIPNRDDLDCADCANHVQGTMPPVCRQCTDEGDRTGQWLPMFLAKRQSEADANRAAWERMNAAEKRVPQTLADVIRRYQDTGSLETSESEAVPFVSTTPRLIGLTGVARSGKDTTADYLVRERGFVKHSFAAPIREFVARILGMTLAELETAKEQPIQWLPGQTPRRLMQTIGTEWGRDSVDPDLWVKSCFERVRRDMAAGRSVVICDVRFDNEARALKKLGGQVWRVTRSGAGTASAHASEAGVSDVLVDRFLANSRAVGDLYELVDGALE